MLKNKIKKLNRYITMLMQSIFYKNQIFLLGIPVHGNLGDHAIALAEEKFIKDNIKCRLTLLETSEVIRHQNIFKRTIGNSTILYTGGGFLGTLWKNEEDMFREILKIFPNNKVIALPQTFYFSDDKDGKMILDESKDIYGNHKNLHLICREKYSYQLMKKEFNKNNIYLLPDMVLYLDNLEENNKRKDILFCIRSDKEKMDYDYDNIKEILNKCGYVKYDYTDTVVNRNIYEKDRKAEVYNKIKEFSNYELVITDRLHGMIFALLSNTPCIVLENKSYKVKGVYEWIKNCNYIKLYNKNTINEDIKTLLSIQKKLYNRQSIIENFDDLKRTIDNK